MMKIGKIFKSLLIRDCFMTSEVFGQIKNKNLRRIIKPNFFKEQRVAL